MAKELYATEISGYLFQKNPYLRRVLGRPQGYAPTGKIHKNILRKYLFFTPKKTRNFYWEGLEETLHFQVAQKILEISSDFQKKFRKKGTLFIECAVPKKVFNCFSEEKFRSYHLPPQRFFVLKLMRERGLSPQEISGFLTRQNKEERCEREGKFPFDFSLENHKIV